MMLQPTRREKKCRVCTTRFTPSRPLQVACCPDCSAEAAAREKAEREAKERDERRQARRAAKAQKLIKEAA